MYLSASRIKTYLVCSWTYYVKYHLGFNYMDESNDGAKRGTICHLILEVLQNPKRKKIVKNILKEEILPAQINKLILKHAKRLKVDDQDNLNLINNFILVGLKSDFYCEGWELQDPEKKFEISSESPEYKILGFIDKHAFSKDGNSVRIDDYKTSKTKFSGKDARFNIQALLYALALFKESNAKKAIVNFIFLKFQKSPVQKFEFSKEVIFGFEQYLGEVYKYLSKFTSKKACENFAKNNENHFLCGKEPGDLKKDGSPAWVCPWKRPFIYYEVKNEDGKIVFTSKDEVKAKEFAKETDVLSCKLYPGCPAFNKLKSKN